MSLIAEFFQGIVKYAKIPPDKTVWARILMSSATTFNVEQESWRPSVSPWIIAISVMLATFMEVLDTSVANVALPHIAGSFSAGTDESTWVLTSYLVSNAIILPATAWFSSLFGRKKFLIICVMLFTLTSFVCGTSVSLGMLIIAEFCRVWAVVRFSLYLRL